jgi:hypothetical protein
MWPAISGYRSFGQVTPFVEKRVSTGRWPLAMEDWSILFIQTSDKNSRGKMLQTHPGALIQKSPAAT